MQHYYLVSRETLQAHDPEHTVTIQTVCAHKNLSGEPCTDGWCGTTNLMNNYKSA